MDGSEVVHVKVVAEPEVWLALIQLFAEKSLPGVLQEVLGPVLGQLFDSGMQLHF